MSAPFRDMRLAGAYEVRLIEPDDFDFWRERARALVQADVPADRVEWAEPGHTGGLSCRGASFRPGTTPPHSWVRM